MSVHPCAWASSKGRELKLSCPERVTLWQLAERAAVKGYCWPSVPHLMEDTGLARQTILTVVHRLADLGLIRIEKVGQKHHYHILMPVQIKTGNRSNTRPEPVQKETGNRSKNSHQPVQNVDPNRSKNSTLTLKRNLKEPNARDAREPESQDLNFRKKAESTQPPANAPATPANDATTDGGNPFSGSDEAKAFMGGILGRTVPLAMPEPETVTEDDPPQTEADGQRMAQQLGNLAKSLAHDLRIRAYPPGRPSKRDKWDQIAAAEGKPLVGEILSPLRPQEPERTVEQQLAELERMMRAAPAMAIAAE